MIFLMFDKTTEICGRYMLQILEGNVFENEAGITTIA
jgi:hypothetical protein